MAEPRTTNGIPAVLKPRIEPGAPSAAPQPAGAKIITPLDPESLTEMRMIGRRLDVMAIRLGRCDLQVAEAEAQRMQARAELGSETAQFKAFVAEQARRLGVAQPWQFDSEIGSFVSG